MSQARVCMLASHRESENGGAHPKGGGIPVERDEGKLRPQYCIPVPP